MAIMVINYDLKAPGRNYQPLYDAIETYTHCTILESCWLVDTTKNAEEVRDHLKGKMDSNDEVFVARLSKNWGTNFKDQATKWLKSQNRNW